MKKILSIIVCTVICFSIFSCVALAYDGGVVPYLNETYVTTSVLSFDASGNATIENKFVGLPGVTTSVTITTKIQQKFLLFFWRDVDIGVSGNQWVDTSTDVRFTCSHSVSLPSGTYRAVVTYTVYGTGGEPDVITEYAEASY